ncbi:J domain-containing protein [Ramlibacter henchirensis]|uniref:J domain-containing protein n=1 Tax=Ramlibacter henchirensis TaxID=204072 RepID=A0A4Z0BMF3_9BURK|nr:J domain-containing protein [Ramlibacter henchirensis]TFY99437.1 J domain-containing protein [Ramlibacter henchirensis]
MAGELHSTFYDELHLPRTASFEDVRSAYRRLAREHHPDRAGADGAAMARINQAYEVLSDPDRRARYDERLDAPKPAPRKPGRVVLPGDRKRYRLKWVLTGVAVVVVSGLAVLAGLRARQAPAPTAKRAQPLSHPLPQPAAQNTARPAGEGSGLRLIPSRSISSVPSAGRPGTAQAQ